MSFFITFEGTEGCGKTTQIGLLQTYLQRKNYSILLTREPGGTATAEQIRRILLSSENSGMEPMTELFLYAAARVEHLQRVIAPAARTGKVVLCDRFIDATVAYQGYGRGLDLTLIDQIHDRILGEIRPDLTFLLDLPVEEGLRRAWKRMEGQSVKEDRFEKEDLAFHRRVREGYLLLARQTPQRIILLDAMKSVQDLHEDILARLPAGLRG